MTGLGALLDCKNALTPHSLRHLFASALLRAGVPLTDVSKYLGHADVNTTSAVYSHLFTDSMDRARTALDAMD